MRRFSLKHGYHDAMVSAISYDEDNILFNVDLCRCCNNAPGPAMIQFVGVRNFDEVREILEAVRQANGGRKHIDEIIRLTRDDDRRFLVCLATAGSIRINARGIFEV